MWPDPGAAELAAARSGWTVHERMQLAEELRDRAFDLAWATLREREATGDPLDEVERARFVLERLYPEMVGPRLEEVVGALAAAQAHGSWHGFMPPASFTRADGPLGR